MSLRHLHGSDEKQLSRIIADYEALMNELCSRVIDFDPDGVDDVLCAMNTQLGRITQKLDARDTVMDAASAREMSAIERREIEKEMA